jgi:hypothetical protein
MEKRIFIGAIVADNFKQKFGKVAMFTCVAEDAEDAARQGNELVEKSFKPSFDFEFDRVEVVVQYADIPDIESLLNSVKAQDPEDDDFIFEAQLLM